MPSAKQHTRIGSRTIASLPQFEHESLLQQALAGLLVRMPDVSDVQIRHGGAHELGKDITFRSTGPIGEPVNCAVVVKNKPFTGKVGAGGSLRVLMDQIEQALDTPFVDDRGEQQRIHVVYVMNPYQTTPTAMAAAEGRLKSRAGQVHFVTGPKLYEQFHRYWPEFLEAETSALAKFARDLEDATSATRSLTAIALSYPFETPSKVAEHVYVSPSFEREVLLHSLPEGRERVLNDAQVRQNWDTTAVRRFEVAADRLTGFLRHLHAWAFPGLTAEPPLDTVIATHEELRRSLATAVRKAADARASETGGLSRLQVDAMVALSDKQQKILAALAHRAEEQAGAWFSQVRDSLSQAAGYLSRLSSHSKDLLADPTFLHACMVDDCLRAAKSELLTVTGRKVFALGKAIHQCRADSLLIVGGPGTGKTTFCTRNALLDAEGYASDADKRLPVYVPLHRLTRANARTFSDLLVPTAGRSALLPAGCVDWKGRALRVYLDGLDEVSDSALRTHVLRLARASQSEGIDCQVIVTARDYLHDPLLAWLPRISLAGLADAEVHSLALQWLDGNVTGTKDFIRQVRRVPAIRALVRVPLLATVTILVYKRTRRIPASRARLYLTFTNMLCGGWDLAKGIVRPSCFDLDSKMHVLSSLASELHSARLRSFTQTRFRNVARRVLSRLRSSDPDALLVEVLRDGLVTRTGSHLHFSHLTFQEFLTAKEMLGDPGSLQIARTLTMYLQGEDWWQEVLSFAIGLSENPERIARWLDRGLPPPGRHPRADLVHGMFEEVFPDFDRERYLHRRKSYPSGRT